MRFARLFGACCATIALAATAGTEDETRQRIAATLFVPESLPALDATSYGSFQIESGVVAERITYGTEFGMRIPAILYRPRPTGLRRPALIVVNGHGGDKYSWYSYYAGILYARAGAVVLTYDPIGEGERNSQKKSGTRAHDVYVPPPEMARRLSGLMITDVMQAVSYLRSRPDVDPRRIAAMGYSMGSFVLSLACALDTRLNACVLVGGGDLDGPGQYWDSSSKQMCQAIPYRSLNFLGDRPAVIFALNARRGPTLIHNGTADETVAIPTHGEWFFRSLQSRASARAGRPAFSYSFTRGGGHRPYFLTRPVAEWLHGRLRFPAWTFRLLKLMPETHIAEWARINHVEMDKEYATEHREGGTRALGRRIPVPTRAQLTVMKDSDWTLHKNDFVLERWIAEARVRCAPVGASK